MRQHELGDYAFMLASIYRQIADQAHEGRIENHFWYGVENLNLSSYEQEELVGALKEWTASLQDLEAVWQGCLNEFWLQVPEIASISEINQFSTIGRSLPELIGGESFDRLDELHQRHDEIREWLNTYANIQADVARLSPAIHAAVIYDKSTAEALSSVAQILRSFGFPEGSKIADLAEDFGTVTKASQLARDVDEILKSIRPNVPIKIGRLFLTTRTGLAELMVFISLLERLPQDLYKYRDEVFENPELDGLLSHLRDRLKVAVPVYARLKDRIALDRLPSSGELKNYLAILEDGGLFRWFSSSWRACRKAIVALSTNPKLNGKEVIALLPDSNSLCRGAGEDREGRPRQPCAGKPVSGHGNAHRQNLGSERLVQGGQI